MFSQWATRTGVLCLLFWCLAAQHASEGTSGNNHNSMPAMDPATMQDIKTTVRRTVRQIVSQLGPSAEVTSSVSQLGPSAEVTSSGTRTRKVKDFTRQFHVGTSCHDIQSTQGADQSGVYLVHPANLVQGPWKVFCDLETEGGGWTVFQVRDDVEPHENFLRNWEDYKVGFGDFDREFWLGNILIWAVTNADNGTLFELAVDLEDWSGNKRFARYRNFRLGPERDAYRLYHQNLYYGNAGDSLYSHNGLPFSTFDVDNDNRQGNYSERSCARLYKGAWWYGNCHDSNLNGWYLGGAHRSFADGITWYTWTGYQYSLRRTEMKLRPQREGPIPIGQDTFIIASRAGRTGEEEGPLEVPEMMRSANTLTRP